MASAPAPAESSPPAGESPHAAVQPPLSARVHAAVGAVTFAFASTLGGALSGDSRAYGADAPERVLSAVFATLESPCASEPPLRCLFLTYATGWQCWSLEARGACAELVSVRDAAPASPALVLPLPQPERAGDAAAPGLPDAARPLVAVAGPDGGEGGGVVRFYSVRRGEYVDAPRAFRAPVLTLRATSRLVAVALETQLYGLDARTLEARHLTPVSWLQGRARPFITPRAQYRRSPSASSPSAAPRPRPRRSASGAPLLRF